MSKAKTQTIYAISTTQHECYGHGDFSDEDKICRRGSYGTGEFPPTFVRREDAERYLATCLLLRPMIVELTLFL